MYLYTKLLMVIKTQSNPSHGAPHIDMCIYTQKGAQLKKRGGAQFASWETMTKSYKH